jgi:hypothetical protein
MTFVFTEPFISAAGAEISLRCPEPVPLRQLVRQWPAALLAPMSGEGPPAEDRILSRFLFSRDGLLVGLDDAVSDTDVITVMMSATGG